MELKADADNLDQKVVELNLTIEKLLQQLYGRKSERRVDGEGHLFLNFGAEPTPEVVSALEEAIREAQEIVDDARRTKEKTPPPTQAQRPQISRAPSTYEEIADLSEEQREGLVLIGYDEVETLECAAAELKVRVTRYAKYAHPVDKSQGIKSPERPTGLSMATALMLLSEWKSWLGSTFSICRFIANKICSRAAAGSRVAPPCNCSKRKSSSLFVH